MQSLGMAWFVKPLVLASMMQDPVPANTPDVLPTVQLREFRLPIKASKQFALDLPAPGNLFLMLRPEQTWGINLKKPQIAAMWAPTQKAYLGFMIGVEPKDREAQSGFTAGYYTHRTQINFGIRALYQEGLHGQVGIKAHFVR